MRRWSQPAKPAWFKDEFADEDLAVGIGMQLTIQDSGANSLSAGTRRRACAIAALITVLGSLFGRASRL